MDSLHSSDSIMSGDDCACLGFCVLCVCGAVVADCFCGDVGVPCGVSLVPCAVSSSLVADDVNLISFVIIRTCIMLDVF